MSAHDSTPHSTRLIGMARQIDLFALRLASSDLKHSHSAPIAFWALAICFLMSIATDRVGLMRDPRHFNSQVKLMNPFCVVMLVVLPLSWLPLEGENMHLVLES